MISNSKIMKGVISVNVDLKPNRNHDVLGMLTNLHI